MTETLTGNNGSTVMNTWLLDAGLFDVQDSDDVRIQETRSLSAGTNGKTGLFVPALDPLTCHWY
jgi:hypothetical protein